jgi:SAM-dependent methyltransferase
MNAAPARRLALHALASLLALVAATARGEHRYDVPYVPTPMVVVEEMLRLAQVQADDFVVDLGCGDGRLAVTAASHFGARALGVDIDPGRIAESHANAKAAGVTGRVEFVQGNLFEQDIGAASVVTLYLLPDVNLRLRPKLLQVLRPGTRVVSHAFDMGDWKPDRTAYVHSKVYLWTVPAQVQGRWRLEADLPGVGARSYELEVRQKYQEIEPFARGEKRNFAVFEPRLHGADIAFVIVDAEMAHRFQGRVEGKTIEGVVHTGAGSAEVQNAFRAYWVGPL